MVRPGLRLFILLVICIFMCVSCGSTRTSQDLDAVQSPELVPQEDQLLGTLEATETTIASQESQIGNGSQPLTVSAIMQKINPRVDDKEAVVTETVLWRSGKSREGRSLQVWRYGPKGNSEGALLLIGGIHGRFEGNTVELAKSYRSYFNQNQPRLPVYILENLNPDGFAVPLGPEGTVPMRFTSTIVDLNRNFPTPTWEKNVKYRNSEVLRNGGGAYPMSEPETRFLIACIDTLVTQHPSLVVVSYHSYVYMAGQKGTIQPAYSGTSKNPVEDAESARMAKIYASAGGISVLSTWVAYPVPGEFLHWSGIQGVTAMDVELSNTTSVVKPLGDGTTHLMRNLAGVRAIIADLTGPEVTVVHSDQQAAEVN